MRIPSGTTDQVIYFVAVDSTDFTTRETGLSSFTVYRSRNGGAATAMTTPTVTEVDGTNMPGVYKLLLDEDMTIGSGNDSEEMVFHITQASMAPVTRVIELYRPKITVGQTLTVASNVGEANVVQFGGDTGYADRLGKFAGALSNAGALTISDTGTMDNFARTLLERQDVDGLKVVEAMRAMAAGLAGKLSGAGTGTETFIGLDDATTRLVATVDSSGNRTAITRTLDTT